MSWTKASKENKCIHRWNLLEVCLVDHQAQDLTLKQVLELKDFLEEAAGALIKSQTKVSTSSVKQRMIELDNLSS